MMDPVSLSIRKRFFRSFLRVLRMALILTTIIILTLITLLQFPSIQQQVVMIVSKGAGDKLGFRIQTGTFRINWLKGTVTSEDISLIPVPMNTPARITIESLKLDMAIPDLILGRYIIEELRIEHPVVTLEQLPDGKLKFPWSESSSSKTEDNNQTNVLSLIGLTGVALRNGDFIIVNQAQELQPVSISGVQLTASMEPALKNIRADLNVQTATWVHPDTLKPAVLSKPLTLKITGDTDQNLALAIETEILQFPISGQGSISLNSHVTAYKLHMAGTGPVSDILSCLGIPDMASQNVSISIALNSSGRPIPDIVCDAAASSLQIHDTSLRDLTLSASVDSEGVSTELKAKTGNGSLHLTGHGGSLPVLSPWDISLEVRQFPLDSFQPWLPETVTIRGFIDGSVIASGSSRDWKQAEAAGSLILHRLPGSPQQTVSKAYLGGKSDIKGSGGSWLIQPTGLIDFSLYNQSVTVTRLQLSDPSLHVDLSGYYGIPDRRWTLDAVMNAGELSPWLLLGGIDGGGKAEITAHFKGGDDVNGISGNGSLLVTEARISGHALDTFHVDTSISNSMFSADLHRLKLDDVIVTGRVSGDVRPPKGRPQTIRAEIDSLQWRDLPQKSYRAEWESSAKGQSASLKSMDGSIDSHWMAASNGVWRGSLTLENFDIEPFAGFLPGLFTGLRGTISARVEGTTENDDRMPEGTLVLKNLDASVWGREIQSAGPATLAYYNRCLSIQQLILTGDDGSRVVANGAWPLEKSGNDGAIQIEISIPQLNAWHIAGIPEEISGSVHTKLVLHIIGSSILTEGTLSATGFRFGEMAVGYATARFLEPDYPGSLKLDLVLDDARSMASESSPRVSCTGTINLPNGIDTVTDPLIELKIQSLDAGLKAIHYSNESEILVRLMDRMLMIDALHLTGPEFSLEISGFMPLEADKTRNGSINISASAGLAPLSGQIPETGALKGSIQVELDIGNSLNNPVITGKATLKRIAMDSPFLPGPLENLDGSIIVSPETIKFDAITGRFGGGRVSVTGGLQRSGMSLNDVNIACRARDIDINYGSDLRVRGNGDFNAGGRWPDVSIDGTIQLSDMVYSPEFDILGILSNLTRPKVIIAEETGDIERLGGIPLDLTIIARDNIRVENATISVSLNSQLQVIGTTRVPGVLGSVNIEGGTIDLLLHEFAVTSGTVNFTQPFEIDPSLDIVAVTRIRDEVITFRITGRASRPNLLLSSDSGKSHADIMNLLLGRDTTGMGNDLSTLAADYAKQALALAAAEAIAARTDLIIVPFPVTLEDENLIFGVGRRFGDRWKVMYYFGEKSAEGDVIELEFQINQKTDMRVRQNQDGSISGGFRYRETFN
ncbi:translocation/assembly module TamB domain-containing protein [bacterium]|nr:translocation/assembly module TamB domain-containing protein [candidate division CSSED10-310 bacterium]